MLQQLLAIQQTINLFPLHAGLVILMFPYVLLFHWGRGAKLKLQ